MSLNVRAWLAERGFGEYADSFEANEIDGEALLGLTDEHLKELGVPLPSRARLLRAIAQHASSRSSREAAGARRSAEVGTAATNPDTATAERRHLTVMFVDLVGSTALS